MPLSSLLSSLQACKLLSSIFSSFEAAELQQYFAPIFNLCLTRLQSNKKVGQGLVSAEGL